MATCSTHFGTERAARHRPRCSGSSIFLYSPLLLMLPWSFPALWRKARPESLTILVIVVCSLLLASRFILWHGLWSSPGPRMLFVATPLFMLGHDLANAAR